MASKNNKAEQAMAISRKFKNIRSLIQHIELEFREIETMVEQENHPKFDSSEILALRLAFADAFRPEISQGESQWHIVAYERGFFYTEPAPQKLSKVNQ